MILRTPDMNFCKIISIIYIYSFGYSIYCLHIYIYIYR